MKPKNKYPPGRNKYPSGWDEQRVRALIAHYESQSEVAAVAEDEAAFDHEGGTMHNSIIMSKKIPEELFVERRPEGDYAVRRPNSKKASAVERTQAKAIDRARELEPHAAIHVERVRHTSKGKPDKWRKP